MNKKIRNMIIALAAIIFVTTGVVQTIPQMTLKAEAIEPYAKGELAPVNSEIAIKQGEMLVAASDGKQLFVNTEHQVKNGLVKLKMQQIIKKNLS